MDSRQGEKEGERKRWLRAQSPVRDSPNRHQTKEDEQGEGASSVSLPPKKLPLSGQWKLQSVIA